jgi:hypothetical protein
MKGKAMADIVLQHNAASYIKAIDAVDPVVVTAGATSNYAYKTGNTITRSSLLPANYLSADFIVPYKATLAAHKKATIKMKVEDSADSSSWAAYGPSEVSTVIGSTGATAAQTLRGALALAVDLADARGYVRFDLQPILSATATDTLAVAGVAALSGSDRNS